MHTMIITTSKTVRSIPKLPRVPDTILTTKGELSEEEMDSQEILVRLVYLNKDA